MNDFNYDNEIIEIGSDTEEKADVLNEPLGEPHVEVLNEKPKKLKRSLKDKWMDIPRKKRNIIIASTVILVLIIVSVILYFTLFKKEKKQEVVEEPIVLEKDNYRYEDGKLIFLDKSDREIGTYECTNKDPDKCMTMKLDYSADTFERVLSVNENGEEITKSSQIYNNNFVFVTDGEYSYLLNINNSKKELKVTNIKTYGTEKNLVVIANEDNKYGLIEIGMEGYDYLIRPSYDNLGIINTKLIYLVAKDKDKTYIIDSESKRVSSNITGTIESANDKYIVVLKNNKYNLYNYENEVLLTDYDYIALNDDVVSLVKNNRLYLRDTSLNKLSEEGFRLENTDYVKKYVYDKDNKLKETKKAFEVVVKDNVALITIGEDTKNINMYEGIVSSKYNYISYFDGKLYFYNDEEKEDILGTYNCNNKNELASNDDVFSNCTLYESDNKISGIYNNNYVIIYDNKNNDDIKYYVYSLKEKKNKGTYSYIELVNSDELAEKIEHIGTNSSYIILVTDTGNNKGNYGVIEINQDKVAGKVAFNYKAIKKEDNYYIFQNTSDLYSIYNVSFSKISNDFNYIKLYDKYYVGILNSKLNVYSYLNNKGILSNPLEVKDNKYEISFDNGFIITIDGETYKYDNTGKLVVEKEEKPEEKPIDKPIDNQEGENENEG